MLAIFQSLYLFYMFNFYKSDFNFNHPLEIFIQKQNINEWLKHSIEKDVYSSKICPLGNFIGIIFPLWILYFNYIADKHKYKTINNIFWILLILGTFLLNFNSFIYIIPIIFIEFIL